MSIRVLHVVPSLGLGGAERLLADLIANTARRGVSHSIIQLGGSEELVPQLRPHVDQLHNLRWSGRREWLRASRAIAAVARDVRAGLIQSVMFDANIAARGARAFGVRANWLTNVVTLEYDAATVELGGYSRRRVLMRRALDASTAAMTATTFVACSDCVAASTRLELRASRVRTIYNAVDPSRLEATDAEARSFRERLGIPPEAFVFTNVSRLAAGKGHELLLEAFSRVRQRLPAAWLVFVGGGPLRDELESRVKALGLGERFRFAGQPERIGPALRASSVFVFPSLIEGLSLALIEATLAGVPVVASDIPPNLEVIRHGVSGLVCARNSAEALASALVAAHDAQERLPEFAAAALASSRATFLAETVFPQWVSLYEALSGRN